MDCFRGSLESFFSPYVLWVNGKSRMWVHRETITAKPSKLGQSPRQVCYFHLNLGRLEKHLHLSPEQQALSRKYSLCSLQQRDSLGSGSRRNSLKGLLNQKLTLLLISVVRWWAMWCKSNPWPTDRKHSPYDYFLHSFIKKNTAHFHGMFHSQDPCKS